MTTIDVRDELLASAKSITPLLRESADRIEEERRLPADIVAAMKEASVFRMAMPESWGGWQADPVTQVLVIEEVSYANGSAGWCTLIGQSGGFLSAMLEDSVGRSMFTDPNMVSAATIVPPGRAEAVEGGLVVNGRWPFASGVTHSDWVESTVVVESAEETMNGKQCVVFVPTEEVELIDTWHTTGLRGTGSLDIAMKDVFVPGERVGELEGNWPRPGPLYGSFTPALLNHFGVPLGLGKHALESYTDAMRAKAGKFGAAPTEEPYVRNALAEAAVRVGASRAYALDLVGRVWDDLQSDGEATKENRIEWRIGNAFVHDTCASAIDILHHASGSKAVYTPNEIDRCFRDIHTARQHAMMSGRVYDQGGAAMFSGEMPPRW